MTTNKWKWIVSFVTNRNTQNIYCVLYRVLAKIMNLNPFNLLPTKILIKQSVQDLWTNLYNFTVEQKVKRRAWAIPAQCRCLLKNKKVNTKMLETKSIMKKCEWIKDEYNNFCYRFVVEDVFQSKISLLEKNKVLKVDIINYKPDWQSITFLRFLTTTKVYNYHHQKSSNSSLLIRNFCRSHKFSIFKLTLANSQLLLVRL